MGLAGALWALGFTPTSHNPVCELIKLHLKRPLGLLFSSFPHPRALTGRLLRSSHCQVPSWSFSRSSLTARWYPFILVLIANLLPASFNPLGLFIHRIGISAFILLGWACLAILISSDKTGSPFLCSPTSPSLQMFSSELIWTDTRQRKVNLARATFKKPIWQHSSFCIYFCIHSYSFFLFLCPILNTVYPPDGFELAWINLFSFLNVPL